MLRWRKRGKRVRSLSRSNVKSPMKESENLRSGAHSIVQHTRVKLEESEDVFVHYSGEVLQLHVGLRLHFETAIFRFLTGVWSLEPGAI